MKKILSIIAGLFIIASIAFVAGNSDLFKGQYQGGPDTSGLPGLGGGGSGIDSRLSETETSNGSGTSAGSDTTRGDDDDDLIGTGFTPTGGGTGGTPIDDDDDDDTVDNKKGFTVAMESAIAMEAVTNAATSPYAGSSNSNTSDSSSSAGTVSSSSTSSASSTSATIAGYYIYLIVKDEDGNYVTDIPEADFNLSGGSASDFTESTSYYTFKFDAEPSAQFSIDTEGYKTAETGTISLEDGSKTASETVTLTAIEYTPECSTLNLSPDDYEISADATSVDDIEITIDVSGAIVEASIWPKFLMAFTISEWSGYVNIETSGSGSFSYSGEWDATETSDGLQITILNSDEASIELTYSGGAVGDTITASTEESCSDSFTITQAEVSTDMTEDTSTETTTTDSSSTEDTSSDSSNKETTTEDINYDAITDDTCEHSFEDIVGKDYEDTICRLAESGVIDGYSDSYFGYDQYISIAEYTKVLLLLAGYDKSNGNSEILLDSSWAEGWVAKAEELDTLRLRDGFSRNLNLPITRADAALYAVRLAEVKYFPTSSPFADVSVDDYFGYAVIYLAETLVDVPNEGEQYALVAKKDDDFEPYDYISRGEAMDMLMNFYLALFES